LERSEMADGTRGNEAGLDEFKEQLVKTSRMYAMCQLAEVENPLDVTGLALAAFADMPLRQALVFIRSNEQTLEDLAWAFRSSNSAEEFEQRLKEIRTLPNGEQQAPGQTRGSGSARRFPQAD
jgi:hypothetical protein